MRASGITRGYMPAPGVMTGGYGPGRSPANLLARYPASTPRSGGRFSMMASMLKKPVTVDSSKSVISF